MLEDENTLFRTPYVQPIGPLSEPDHAFAIGGYAVPNVRGSLKPGTENEWALVLDHRFGIHATQEEMERWLPFLAHAMAIGAGYSCHGQNCTPRNPYQVQVLTVEGELP